MALSAREWRLLEEKLAELEPAVRQAFTEAVQRWAGQVPLADLIALIEEGQIAAALELVRIPDAWMTPTNEAVRAAFIAGGLTAGDLVTAAVRARFGFGVNPRAEAWARSTSSRMIDGVNENLPEIQGYIAQAVDKGIPARQIALEITGRVDPATRRRTGGLLGLNSTQTDAAIKARQQLDGLDDDYFTRKLRDKRYDATVRKAIRDGKPLTRAQIDKISGSYKDRLLAYRGKVIARTEALNALRAGQHEGFRQMLDAGLVAGLEVKWLDTADGRTRDSHVALGGLPAQPFGTPFISPATGALMDFPGDTSHGARGEDVIQCFPPGAMISRVGITHAMRRYYSGDLVELRATGDIVMSVTPNHPILTGRGWVSAGEVNEGDEVFECRVGDLAKVSSGPDICAVDVSAEHLYNSAQSLSVPVRPDRAVVDFHGDIPDHDVDIVAVDGGLGDALVPEVGEMISNVIFSCPDEMSGYLIARRMGRMSDLAVSDFPDCRMGGSSPCLPGIRGEDCSGAPIAFGNAWPLDPEIIKAPANSGPANSNGFGYRKDRVTAIKEILDRIKIRNPLGCISFFGLLPNANSPVHSRGLDVGNAGDHHCSAYAGHFCDLHGAATCFHSRSDRAQKRGALVAPMVSRRSITHVSRSYYSGYVYNFTSSSGVLVSDGIVNHNCRCAAIYTPVKS